MGTTVQHIDYFGLNQDFIEKNSRLQVLQVVLRKTGAPDCLRQKQKSSQVAKPALLTPYPE